MIKNLKPYTKYKKADTLWFERVPEDWTVVQLRRYTKVFSGGTPKRDLPEYWEDGNIPWLASGAVNQRRIKKASQHITELGLTSSSAKWIREKSLVLALAGQGKTKGMVATVEFPVTGNQSLAVIEPEKNKIDYRYLAYYLEGQYKNVRSLVGNDMRDGLNLEHVKSIRIPLPSLQEQQLIARFLDNIEVKIQSYVRIKLQVIKILQERKLSLIQKAIFRDAPHPTSLIKGRWLESLPHGWTKKRFKYLLKEIDSRSKDGAEQLLRLSQYTGITPRVNEESGETLTRAVSLVGYKRVKPGDLVINIMLAWNGSLALSGHQGIVSPAYCVYEFLPGVDGRYIDFLLKTPLYKAQIKAHSTGVIDSRLRLYTEKLGQIEALLPPLNEQIEIVKFIERNTATINSVIETTRKEIVLLKELQSRLITETTIGAFDVQKLASNMLDVYVNLDATEHLGYDDDTEESDISPEIESENAAV